MLSAHESLIWSRKRKRSVLKSVRMSEELSRLLEEDAEAKGIAFNSLFSSLAARYAEWDRYSERFGFVTCTGDFFALLLKSVDPAELERLLLAQKHQIIYDMMLFWFKDASTESFLRLLKLQAKYTGLYDIETKTDTDGHIIILRPRYEKLGRVLAVSLADFVRKQFNANPEIKETASSVVLRFRISG